MKTLLIIVALMVLGFCGPVLAEEISYAEAYQAAVDGKQPMVILCGAKWCPGCRILHAAMKLQRRPFVYNDIDAPLPVGQVSGYIPQVWTATKTDSGWVWKRER